MNSINNHLSLSVHTDPYPLPDLPPVEPWSDDLLPEPLAHFVRDTATSMQAPPDFIAVPLIVGLASVIGTKVRIQPKCLDEDWTIVPNLWGANIGGPSSMKTPTMSKALSPLRTLEKNALDKYQSAIAAHEANEAITEIKEKEAKQSAINSFQNGNAEQAKIDLLQVQEDRGKPPTLKRYLVNDTTTPKLASILSENPNGLLLERDELTGWLADMKNESKQNERAFYLECYNGTNSHTVDRIERGTQFIHNACLSIVGGIQPAPLADLVKTTVSGSMDDGLLQRLQLMVWPDTVRDKRYIDMRPCQDTKQRVKDVFDRLDAIPKKEEGFHRYKFDSKAQKIFADWMNELFNDIETSNYHPAFESHISKMQKTVPSLALVFALIEDKDTVCEQCLLRALSWFEYLISHAKRVYNAKLNPKIEKAKLLLQKKEKLGLSFTLRDLSRKQWSGLSERPDQLAAINVLEEHGYLIRTIQETNNVGRKPADLLTWNPKLEAYNAKVA